MRIYSVITALFLLAVTSCSTSIKVQRLKREPVSAALSLAQEVKMRELSTESNNSDTLVVTDEDGHQMLIMKAVRDENGEMVASDVLDAAVVKARFRNVAERGGRVELRFQIEVPKSLIDSKWQLRFYPKMILPDDVKELDKVFITGKLYRQSQLRGYQQYEKFIDSIIKDSALFVRRNELELFLQRNIPELYAMKNDTSFVSDEKFASIYGVTKREAVSHYTNRFVIMSNRRKINRKDRVYSRFVKSPILTEGMRLDTVLVEGDDFVYEYCQPIQANGSLRKVDILLEGEICEDGKKVYDIPGGEALTFYISSLSSLVDETPHYVCRIVKRQVNETVACWLDFETSSSELNPDLSNNRSETDRIKSNFSELLSHDDLVLDSVTVTASCSPEGSYSLNKSLAIGRSESVINYFQGIIENGDIVWKTCCIPEHWDMLLNLTMADSTLSGKEKDEVLHAMKIEDPDRRERSLSTRPYYRHMRETIYPRLRTVKFDFYLHRKGMVNDTIITTTLDTLYHYGVDRLKERDYETALKVLWPYADFNTALCLKALDRNATALSILETLPSSDKSEYLLAVVHARMGDDASAVQHYINACRLNPSFVHRGNLDPEIAFLIDKYDLNLYQSKQ